MPPLDPTTLGPQPRSMRWALAISLVMLGAGVARAQTDLGTIRVTRPPRPASGDFVVVDRLPVPRIDASEVPTAAAVPLLRYYAATELLVGTAAELRSGPTPERAQALRAALPSYESDRAAWRERLMAVLDRAFDTLGRAARLVLGELRYELAAEAALAELDRCEACGDDACVVTADAAPARRAWSHVTGSDALTAHALYQRAYVAAQEGDAEARTLIEQALAITPVPAELEPRLHFMLGELLAPDDPHAARESFDRCAAIASPFAVHCAIRSAELDLARGRGARAVVTLAPFVGTSDPADGLVAEALLSLDAPSLPERVPAASRAALLTLGGERLASLGLGTQARAWLDAAVALEPALGPRRDALATPPSDTPQAWLARAVTYCLHRVDASSVVAIDVSARVTGRSHAVRALRVRAASTDLGTCLAHDAPSPESPLRGSFRASITIEP